ncbi:hypothetical protein GDO81_012692 [Engystomops pustulosus]|uniref:Uncharacterized protein n=1 Tax=Engystomops pustulosus TaxID=76066 RepID=A0AAV7B1M9_ENGPU|nr:hypothetical protein GDO81_012692 [Engystomops pustulosus]
MIDPYFPPWTSTGQYPSLHLPLSQWIVVHKLLSNFFFNSTKRLREDSSPSPLLHCFLRVTDGLDLYQFCLRFLVLTALRFYFLEFQCELKWPKQRSK